MPTYGTQKYNRYTSNRYTPNRYTPNRYKKSKNSGKTCGLIILIGIGFIVVLSLLGPVISKITGKTSTPTAKMEFLGADPKAFASAQELYSFTPKQKLTVSEVSSQMVKFQSMVDSGTYPENNAFRPLLLLLDGAADLDSIEKAIEHAVPTYVARSDFSKSPSSTNSKANKAFTDGNTQYESGKFEMAAQKYIEVLSLVPGHLDARNNLGLCDLHLGNNVSALMHFNLILAASPKYLGAEQNLSVALERIGLSSKALAHARNIVAQDASLPMAQYNLGWFALQNKSYTEATAAFSKALELYPDYSKALHANTINKLASGEKLSKSDISNLPKAEQAAYSSDPQKATAQPASTQPARSQPTSSNPVTVKPKSVATVWWWVFMVIAIITLIGLTLRAAMNDRVGGFGWGAITAIGMIIAVIVFAVWFRGSSTYSIVLWSFVGLNILVMIPGSSKKR
jgi:tetratricopeptide (TPR) repeat protein